MKDYQKQNTRRSFKILLACQSKALGKLKHLNEKYATQNHALNRYLFFALL